MSTAELRDTAAAEGLRAAAFEMKLEVVVLPVTDIDRAKCFYANLGWRLDLDFSAEDGYRVIQFTPPSSGCSVIFGKDVTTAATGSAQGMLLVVSDVVSARDQLLRRGVEVSELFHDASGVFHHADGKSLLHGPNPQRHSYASYASFCDPDGNRFVLQEVTARLPGTPGTRDANFTPGIVDALRRMENRS